MYRQKDGEWEFAAGPVIEDNKPVVLTPRFVLTGENRAYRQDPEFEKYVDWCFEEFRKDRPNLFDNGGDLARVLDFPKLNETTLEIKLGVTDYHHYMATTVAIEEGRQDMLDAAPQTITLQNCSNVLNYLPAVVTSDGRLLYSQRGANLASYRNQRSTFGIVPKKALLDRDEYFEHVRKMLRGELLLDPDADIDVEMYGIARTKGFKFPPLLITRISQSSEDIIKRLYDADGKLVNPVSKKYERIK